LIRQRDNVAGPLLVLFHRQDLARVEQRSAKIGHGRRDTRGICEEPLLDGRPL